MTVTALLAAFRAWWRHNVVDDDPSPEYGDLDKRDGLPRRK